MRLALALHTDDGVTYGVTVPDLPGCFSAGESLDQAIENAYEAIDAHVELLMDDGDAVPCPRPLAEHQSNPDFAGAVWVVIDAPIERYFGPTEKIHIRVPRRLLQRIDAYARARHLSRSAFLTQVASEAMGREGPCRNQ
ncbi:type II toxin-antitoxin system HicB family antitoxin [Allochromatium humboldtianum]|uniref:Type II toxin-antitoxin system HicB family antitoxin n=1 Tax=Allochromatium humboldtianum TaxID=504901 RepID=A0A850RGP0_9GAMM|nr:type II toxin-antitoxin system HicB family antitoxin [Allochromatium humboldtianum]NVZ10322.1 type II toxin-antitoxin system HicB family antitoxin [Allochromatium humboldtianum]